MPVCICVRMSSWPLTRERRSKVVSSHVTDINLVIYSTQHRQNDNDNDSMSKSKSCNIFNQLRGCGWERKRKRESKRVDEVICGPNLLSFPPLSIVKVIFFLPFLFHTHTKGPAKVVCILGGEIELKLHLPRERPWGIDLDSCLIHKRNFLFSSQFARIFLFFSYSGLCLLFAYEFLFFSLSLSLPPFRWLVMRMSVLSCDVLTDFSSSCPSFILSSHSTHISNFSLSPPLFLLSFTRVLFFLLPSQLTSEESEKEYLEVWQGNIWTLKALWLTGPQLEFHLRCH